MKVSILKGTIIQDGCIIGAASVVSGNYSTENCLIAGNPAQIRKYNVTRFV